MAATGLLGINPYQKGVAIDIASKPINLAIQLEQKERAKQEALDKYLMDYEKTLNPAGMRKQDQDVFLSKLSQAKQYYLSDPYTEDRRGSAARPGPGMGGICPNGRIISFGL